MITLDTVYTVFTSLGGLGSSIMAILMFSDPITSIPLGGSSDISPLTLIVSIIGTVMLGLLRITNSVKNLEETNAKILNTQTELLKSNNELLRISSNDSAKHDKVIENQNRQLEVDHKSLDAMTKFIVKSNSTNAKKPGKSGIYQVDKDKDKR